jgi:bifunctional non-homologous end joining protein LigD
VLLKQYRQKRKFAVTPEPEGSILRTSKDRFVVHDHFAGKAGHHHDFRLEMNGVLKSWAIPKRMPNKEGVKRLAIQVEDHPIDYINFRGKIPKGFYGAGTVKILDEGKYRLKERKKDKIVLELNGKKLRGHYCLIKFKKDKQWLIFKMK